MQEYYPVYSLIFVGMTLYIYNLRKGKKVFCWEYAKFAITFNAPLLLHYLSVYVLDQFDRIMIQKMNGIAAAGIYSVAYNAGMIMKVFTQSVTNAMVPWQYEKLEKKEISTVDNILFLVFIGMAGIAIMFSACAPEIMKVLADQKYYEAVYVIPPVAIGLFFEFIYIAIGNVEFFYNQTKFTMYISMAGAFLNIILNYIGIHMFGYIAAAYTTLICYIAFALMHYIYMTYCIKRELNINHVFRTDRLVVLSLIVIGLGIVVIFLYNYIVPRYLLIFGCLCLTLIKRKTITSIIRMIRNE